MSMLILFAALYAAPAAVTLIGGIPFVVRDRRLVWSLLLLAAFPLFNIFLAATVLVVGSQMLFDRHKQKGW